MVASYPYVEGDDRPFWVRVGCWWHAMEAGGVHEEFDVVDDGLQWEGGKRVAFRAEGFALPCHPRHPLIALASSLCGTSDSKMALWCISQQNLDFYLKALERRRIRHGLPSGAGDPAHG